MLEVPLSDRTLFNFWNLCPSPWWPFPGISLLKGCSWDQIKLLKSLYFQWWKSAGLMEGKESQKPQDSGTTLTSKILPYFLVRSQGDLILGCKRVQRFPPRNCKKTKPIHRSLWGVTLILLGLVCVYFKHRFQWRRWGLWFWFQRDLWAGSRTAHFIWLLFSSCPAFSSLFSCSHNYAQLFIIVGFWS